MEERAERLGFVPQKETIYNKLLVYGDKLDEESQIHLAEIKTNLGKAILVQNLRDVVHWIKNLSKYIRAYGRKFSKEDHIHFIKVCYELLIIPDVELTFVKMVANLLFSLLKKTELLTRDDLVLPWRPLYELYENIFFLSFESYGMIYFPCDLERSLKSVIKACNPYFSVDSTQEILDQFKPLMCPFDAEMDRAMLYFELLLCTNLPPSEHEKGFKLWFDDFMKLWKDCHAVPSWENGLIFLLGRLAKDNIGYIDWEPHIPELFTRLLRSFNLPGRGLKFQVLRTMCTFDPQMVSTLIVSMMGNGSSCQQYIDRLFKALESFFHPSNHGRWLNKIQRVLKCLPLAFIKRLHRERYMKPSWLTPIPDAYKLTEPEITAFVNSLVPAALLSMFSKRGCLDSAGALQHLGNMRPELVIPPLLERLYSSLETLTEPHRLTAALHCIVTVGRPLVRSSKYYPEGRSHVIPLLMGALPGIDPNDIKKCMVTFQFITSLGSMILFVDCSSAANNPDLPQDVRDLCIATAAFEDFVLLFMDRIFLLIENSSLDNLSRLDRDSERKNPEENFMEVGVYSTFSVILMQSSPQICKVAIDKLYNFVTTHILETSVSGKFAAHLCRVACRIAPEYSIQKFVLYYTKLILDLTQNEDVLKEEHLDDEILFSLLILSEVARSSGQYLLQHHDSIVKVLERTLRLTCKAGYCLASFILEHLLKSYINIGAVELCSIVDPWDKYTEENVYRYLDDWGKPGDLKNLNIQYSNPSEEKTTAAKSLLETFLVPEVESLKKFAAKEITLPRETVHRSLCVVISALYGAAASLPVWEGEQIFLRPSSLPPYKPHVLECGGTEITIHGKNGRQYLAEAIRQLFAHIIEACEDDTKSLKYIIKIYQSLIFNWGSEKSKFDARWKYFALIKNIYDDKLRGHKSHMRNILIDRVNLQHELRLTEKYKTFFTEMHTLVITDLMKLATSHYSEIRKDAQFVLRSCISTYSSSYKIAFPYIMDLLKKDPMVYHEEFKGVLHVILGNKQNSLLKLHSWDDTGELFAALVSSQHSEKPSIIRLLEAISNSIEENFPTNQIVVQIPSNCMDVAKQFWSGSKPTPLSPALTDLEIQQNTEMCNQRNDAASKSYLNLVQNLTDLLKSGSLHWRHYNLTLTMLVSLVRPDIRIPRDGVEIFVSHLIHERIAVRKLSMHGLTAVLRQQKRRNPKIEIDPVAPNSAITSVHPLMLKSVTDTQCDRLWLQYNSTDFPDTLEKWNARHFVHKTHLGYSEWPKSFKVHALDCDLPNTDRTYEQLSEEEKPIYDAFMQQSYVDKLISYLSLEEKKDHDKFDYKKFYMFKFIFNNFGDQFLPLFLEHLDRMVEDKHESVQRCASEIIAGLLSSCKHWNFQKMHNLKDKLSPVFKKLLNSVTPESIGDWTTSFTTLAGSRDPMKYYWFFELFMQEPQSVENGSFLESSWIFLLICMLSQQEWRVCELLHRALDYVKPKLNHSYQNVREKIGCILVYIFMYDVPSNDNIADFVPKRGPFLESVLPQLTILEADDKSEMDTNNSTLEESPEKKNARNLFRTLCCYIISNGEKSLYPAPPEIIKILPTLCLMTNDSTDESFQRDCKVALAILGQSLLNNESMDAAIETLKSIASGNSWHSRVSASSYLQTMVFCNLYKIMQNKVWINDIYNMILQLLEDENVEVRESAAETLCGFLHCEFFAISDDFLNMLKEKSRCKLIYKTSASTSNGPKTFEPDELRKRHAGILGLCACINAYPYDVPDFLPDVLVLLGDHLNDPQPISATIKKTLSSFRRTHYDNWRDHKLKFTDDQLTVITDLLVSPSYYA